MDATVAELVMAARSGAAKPLRRTVAIVMDAAALPTVPGVPLQGFRHTISSQGVAHVFATHGNEETERSRGQIAVEAADFERAAEIVGTPDRVRIEDARGRNGQARLGFVKKIGAISYSYVGEVQAGKRRIEMVTMWKR